MRAHAGVAQLVEQRIRNAKVGSSNLFSGTKSVRTRPRVLPLALLLDNLHHNPPDIQYRP
jgi:hypothetical protein